MYQALHVQEDEVIARDHAVVRFHAVHAAVAVHDPPLIAFVTVEELDQFVAQKAYVIEFELKLVAEHCLIVQLSFERVTVPLLHVAVAVQLPVVVDLDTDLEDPHQPNSGME